MRTLALLLLLLAARTVPLAAQEGGEKEPDPPYSMPTEDIFTEDELRTKFEYRKTKPYGDETLALVLPTRTTWKWIELKSPTRIDAEHMIPLARAEPSDDPDVSIEMKYVVLPREVKLEDWIDFFADTQGMHVVHAQRGTYFGRTVVDLLAEFQVKDGRTFVARVGFFKSGNRVYMIAGSAPPDKYEEHSAEFGLAVTAGTPVTLSTEEFAEPMAEFRFPVGCKTIFTYPASWTLIEVSSPPSGVQAVELCTDDPKKPVGLIKVRSYAKDRIDDLTPEKVTWSVFEEIKELGADFKLEEKVQEMESSTDLFPGPGKMCLYRIRLGDTPMEVHELVLDCPESIFAVYLITPPRQRAPRLWMINRRAWEIVGMRLRRES